MSRAALIDFALVAALTAMWGSAFVLIEFALPEFSPAMIAFLRIGAAAIFVVIWALATGAGVPKTSAHWAKCAALGFFGFAFPFFMVPLGQEYVNSATAALLMAFSPISTLILAHFLTQDEKMTTRRLLAVVLGFSGILVLFGSGLDFKTMGVGGGALLAAAFSYAIAGLVMKSLRTFSDVSSSAGSLITGTLWCLPAMGLRSDFAKITSVFDASSQAIISLVVLAIGPTGLATILVLWVVRRRGATFAATSNYGVPVFGVLLGAAVLGDPIGWNILVTLALILMAIWLAQPNPTASG
ncbi:MAG: DMT family transporter [Pseudomonadota bacterium]